MQGVVDQKNEEGSYAGSKVTVSNLFVYPLKSGHELEIAKTGVCPFGLVNDRVLLILKKSDNKFVDVRRSKLKLYDIETSVDQDNILKVTVPERGSYKVDLKVDESLLNSKSIITVNIWDMFCEVCPVGNEDLNKSLSDYLKEEVFLVKPVSSRKTGDDGRRKTFSEDFKQSDEVHFADCAPIMISSEESFNHINKLVNEKTGETLQVNNFRSNIILKDNSGTLKPFWENNIKRIKIGNIVLRKIVGCTRCKFTTFDTLTKNYRTSKEPLEVLNSESYDDFLEGVVFGQYFGVDLKETEENTIQVGDYVEF